MRPRAIEEIVGQPALAADAPLSLLLKSGRMPSLLFWGPPGSGKTTLARLVAGRIGRDFLPLSAVAAGVKEVRAAVDAAREARVDGRGTLLFVDEIHHFNRAQQDALLPHVEDGTIVFAGATTENPSFHVNAALLSRCTVVVLEALSTDALIVIARRALADGERGLGGRGVRLDDEAIRLLAATSHGDARSLLNRLESLVEAAASAGVRAVDANTAERLGGAKRPAYDKSGDNHYDFVSALHKSIRGGDPQATLYYLVRMLDGGEPPLYVGRRLVRIAAEDIGLADPQAIRIALDAVETFKFLGSPEGELALAEAAVYLATAPKSNRVYVAWKAALDAARATPAAAVPLHIRNAPTGLMKELGYGAGYQYAHDAPDGYVPQDYLPDELAERTFYVPGAFGFEKEVEKRLAWWRALRERQEQGQGSPTKPGGVMPPLPEER